MPPLPACLVCRILGYTVLLSPPAWWLFRIGQETQLYDIPHNMRILSSSPGTLAVTVLYHAAQV